MTGRWLDLTGLGTYRLIEKLGIGSMGTVFLAEHDGSQVALKVIHPHLMEKPGFFKRFQREALAGQKVRHENVVRTFECDFIMVEDTPVCFLVMEYVEGRTLRDLLGDLGMVPEGMLRELAAQTAAGLGAIHREGIVHRDVKPENVLITNDQRVRIMDLGVARIHGATTSLTKEGQFAGSVMYAAPEQIHPREVGPWTDLYALGVILYELGTGENPFRRDDPAAMLRAHLDVVPPPMNERNPEVSTFLSEVVASLLAKDPSERFESAESLRDVLRQGEWSAWWAKKEPTLLLARRFRPKIPIRRETEVFGREAELGQVRSVWERAREADGRALLLEGEAGIGKTRLVDVFLDELEGEDVHLLYGSYSPTGVRGGLSRAILNRFGRQGLADALRPYLTVTPDLVPGFAAIIRHESTPPGSQPVGGDALHAVFCHLLRALAAEKPLVWVVEDLHHAAPEDRDLVLSLARALEGHRVLLFLTTRPGLPEGEVARFARLPSFERATMGRLSPREVVRLLRDAFKSDALADKLGAKIAYKSDGVPFFIVEMIRGLKEGQFLSQLPDGSHIETKIIEEIEVPSAVRDLISARLTGLSDEERNLLDAAAVQGFEFDADLLAHVLGVPVVHALQVLAAIERRSSVVRGAGPAYRFDHHQIQEVVYEELAERLLREYHARLAEAFEELGAEDGEHHGDGCHFIALHHLLGSRPVKAEPYLLRAVDHLSNAYRNEAALHLIDLALAEEGALSNEEQVDLLLAMTHCLQILGRHDDLLGAAERAVELADRCGDPARKAQTRGTLGNHLAHVGRPDEAIARIEEALELAREAKDRRLELVACGEMGNAVYAMGRFEEARGWHEKRLQIATEIGDRKGIAGATGNLGVLLSMLGRHDEAESHYRQAAEGMRQVEDRRGEASFVGNLANSLMMRGRMEEARELYVKALDMCREMGYRRGEALWSGNLGNVFSHIGWLEEALNHFRGLREIAGEVADVEALASALGNLGNTLHDLGDLDAARSSFEEARQICRDARLPQLEGYATFGLGMCAEAEGSPDDAEREYGAALRLWQGISYPLGVTSSHIALGRCLFRAGRPDEAAAHLEKAQEQAREAESHLHLARAGALLAELGRDHAPTEELLAGGSERLPIGARMEAHLHLFRATGNHDHLAEARRLLAYLRAHAPDEYRESMVENVALHREIQATE